MSIARFRFAGLFPTLLVAAASLGADADSSRKDRVVPLPPVEVREDALTDFGLSVVTNRDVAVGGKVAWMLVGTVVPNSGAAVAGLRSGDKILRIDEVPVTKFSKPEMLRVFFGRERGDELRLEVADPKTGARRHVRIECNRVRIDRATPRR